MLQTFIVKGSFQDSVSLMLVSRDLSKAGDVNRVSIMMGTPANKEVFKETGMWSDALSDAGPNDICVAIDTPSNDPSIVERVRERMNEALRKMASSRKSAGYPLVHSFSRAQKILPEANIALISIAGAYAGGVAREALERGLNVMLFSDNVPVQTERELKAFARSRDLLVMGPDCGTSIIGDAPLAFANRTAKGPVGIVGASGTGIQEITSQLARRGVGITEAIGLGGRDLKAEVGGISARSALRMLENDPATKVVVFVSKPPAESVRTEVSRQMESMSKPVVALFLGKNPEKRISGNVYYAYTLDEAAQIAADLVKAQETAEGLPAAGRGICGLFTGGTLASETAMLLSQVLRTPEDHEHRDGFMLDAPGVQVIDLGDDVYTRGRPHPMIDPGVRGERIEALSEDCGVLLIDVVLGFGANPDPAGAVAESVEKLRTKRKSALAVIATLTGTDLDPQSLEEQTDKLARAGVTVVPSTRAAVMTAQAILMKNRQMQGDVPALFKQETAVINIGLQNFADDLEANGVRCVHFKWAPSCGGDTRLQKLLAQMI